MSNTDTDKTAALYRAIAAAQAAAQSVGKDGRNAYHNYRYASAEAMIAEAKTLLDPAGLALVPLVFGFVPSPLSSEIATESGPKHFGSVGMLRAEWLLVHRDGGSVPIESLWPVVPEKGRPVDKAVAAARTASLGYLLRDLLQLPRVDESDDLDHPSRDQPRSHAAAPASKPQSSKSPPPKPPQAAPPVSQDETPRPVSRPTGVFPRNIRGDRQQEARWPPAEQDAQLARLGAKLRDGKIKASSVPKAARHPKCTFDDAHLAMIDAMAYAHDVNSDDATDELRALALDGFAIVQRLEPLASRSREPGEEG